MQFSMSPTIVPFHQQGKLLFQERFSKCLQEVSKFYAQSSPGEC